MSKKHVCSRQHELKSCEIRKKLNNYKNVQNLQNDRIQTTVSKRLFSPLRLHLTVTSEKRDYQDFLLNKIFENHISANCCKHNKPISIYLYITERKLQNLSLGWYPMYLFKILKLPSQLQLLYHSF